MITMKKIDYLQDLRNIAECNGGELLSDKWINTLSRYKFKHHTGEIFDAFAYVIKKNGWPTVLHKYKPIEFYMENMKEIAKNNGGELISETWLNTKTMYRFKNKNGSLFEKSYSKLIQYGWPKLNTAINQDEIDLNDLRDKADENGFDLLESEWNGWNKKYVFQHRLLKINCLISARSIKQNGFPKEPEEIENNKNLNRLKAIAELDGFTLLENNWKGINFNYSFNKGPTVIKAKGIHVLKRKKLILSIKKFKEIKPIIEKSDYLKMMQDIAVSYNGKLLSNKWIGSKKKYLFETNDGKQFQRSYKTLKELGWLKPRYVPPKVDQLDDLKTIAELNKGELLSNTWNGCEAKYEFKHHLGEVFEAYAHRILRGKWPKKLNKYRDKNYFLNDMKNLALKRGGILLSNTYINRLTKYKFRDAYDEEFEMSYGMLKAGNWNGNNGYISEPIVKQALNHLYNSQFIKTKKVLTKELIGRDNPLELDGYCKELKIAFEYQGHPSHWDENYKLYEKVHARDVIKQEICKKLGIVLILVPVFKKARDIWIDEEVIKHIKQAINIAYKESNLPLPNLNNNNFLIDFKKISSTRESFQSLKNLVEASNGKLLTKKWHGSDYKYEFQFDTGEVFFRSHKKMMELGWPTNKEKYLKFHAKSTRD
jgi:hypothetical protein